jgi:hypothetical protein
MGAGSLFLGERSCVAGNCVVEVRNDLMVFENSLMEFGND